MKLISTLIGILVMFQFSLHAQVKNSNAEEYICGFGRDLTLKNNQTDSSGTATSYVSPAKIVIRCGLSSSYDETLYVIDGYPVLNVEELKKLNVNDIERIDVLTDATATALFGCRASHGVIIITTKQANLRKFIIKDFQDGTRIPRATVSFISLDKKDTIMMAANDSGVVVTDGIKQSTDYLVITSSVGYKTHTIFFKNTYAYKWQEIMLERDVNICKEVIITDFVHTRRCRCGCMLGSKITYLGSKPENIAKMEVGKVFPNPVQRGSLFSIQFNTDERNDKVLRITSMDGKSMLQQVVKADEGNNVFQIHADSRWAAGIYIVQIYGNGKLMTSDKILIQ